MSAADIEAEHRRRAIATKRLITDLQSAKKRSARKWGIYNQLLAAAHPVDCQISGCKRRPNPGYRYCWTHRQQENAAPTLGLDPMNIWDGLDLS